MQAPGSILRERDFKLLAGGRAVSALGDAIMQTAMPLLVLAVTGSGTQTGMVAMLQSVPMLIFGIMAGALADRLDRRRAMMWCDVGRAVLIGAIPAAIMLALPVMPVVYGVVVPVGFLWVMFEATSLAAVPSLVGRERLTAANAYLSIASSVGYVVGPGIGGLLVAAFGAGYALGVDALTLAISAGALALIARPLQLETARGGSLLRDATVGLRYLARERVLRAVLVYWAVISLLTAPLVVVVTYYVTRDRGMSERALGLVVSMYAAGAVLGAAATSRFANAPPIRAMVIGGTVTGAAVASLVALHSLAAIVVAAMIAGVSESMAIVHYTTLRARRTPDALLGRVISASRVVTFGLQPLSMIAAGVLLDAIGGAATLLMIGAAIVLASLAFIARGGLRLSADAPTAASDTST